MKRQILAVLSMFALVPGALRAQEAHKILFTEKELNAGGGRVTFTNNFYYCRVGIEYVAEKPLTLVVKPCHNAFMGLWRHTFPACAEPQSGTCDFCMTIAPDELEFSVECRGTNEVRSLVVESIPRNEYVSSTTIPNPLRKGSSIQEQIKKAYAAAKPHPVILFGDSLTANWRGARFTYMATNFPVVNAGICGDRIEHLLWRIEDMRDLLTNNPPSVATFLIGTNNFNLQSTPEDIEKGVEKLVRTIRELCPETKIIVFGIPPRAMSWKGRPLVFTIGSNMLLWRMVGKLRGEGDNEIYPFDFSPLLLDNLTGMILKDYYMGDALHFSDKGYAEVVTPFVAGAIRLVTARNLPPGYMADMLAWERYLSARLGDTQWHFALEELLACEAHLDAIPAHWMKVFAKLEADPDYTPEMPDEYLRQKREEGLPDSF